MAMLWILIHSGASVPLFKNEHKPVRPQVWLRIVTPPHPAPGIHDLGVFFTVFNTVENALDNRFAILPHTRL